MQAVPLQCCARLRRDSRRITAASDARSPCILAFRQMPCIWPWPAGCVTQPVWLQTPAAASARRTVMHLSPRCPLMHWSSHAACAAFASFCCSCVVTAMTAPKPARPRPHMCATGDGDVRLSGGNAIYGRVEMYSTANSAWGECWRVLHPWCHCSCCSAAPRHLSCTWLPSTHACFVFLQIVCIKRRASGAQMCVLSGAGGRASCFLFSSVSSARAAAKQHQQARPGCAWLSAVPTGGHGVHTLGAGQGGYACAVRLGDCMLRCTRPHGVRMGKVATPHFAENRLVHGTVILHSFSPPIGHETYV